jgi:hypothetical protein
MMKIFIVSYSSRDEVQKIKMEVLNDDTVGTVSERLREKIAAPVSNFEFYDEESGKFRDLERASLFRNRNTFYQVLVVEEPVNLAETLLIEGRSFDISGGLEIQGHPLYIGEHSNHSEGTGLNTWDGAVVLAKFLDLSENHHLVRGKKVLELGAGTGTAGLACALIGSSLTVLTDLQYTLPNLKHNAALVQTYINSKTTQLSAPSSPTSTTAASVFVSPLDWFEPLSFVSPVHYLPSSSMATWDVILG